MLRSLILALILEMLIWVSNYGALDDVLAGRDRLTADCIDIEESFILRVLGTDMMPVKTFLTESAWQKLMSQKQLGKIILCHIHKVHVT